MSDEEVTQARARYQTLMDRYMAERAKNMRLNEAYTSLMREFISLCEEKDEEPPEPDGESYRGGEYESALAESQAEAQSLKR